MKIQAKLCTVIGILFLVGFLGGCAVGPPASPYYGTVYDQPGGEAQERFTLGPNDVTYVLDVDDRTPFGLGYLPLTVDRLYAKGYDMVRRQRDADFAVDVIFSAGSRDNPEVRGANFLGGALFGAAAGAVIGAAAGDPGVGAAIGAASGGALGMVSPADTPLVRIDVNLTSFRGGYNGHQSTVVDLSRVAPPDVRYAIDTEVSRMLHSLPRR